MQIFKTVDEILAEGVTFHKQERLNLAESKYLEVLQEDCDNAQALFLLGTIYMVSKRMGLACQLLMRCVMLKGSHFEAWNNLGNCYKSMNKEPDALACWEKALDVEGRQDFEYSDIYNNIAFFGIDVGLTSHICKKIRIEVVFKKGADY